MSAEAKEKNSKMGLALVCADGRLQQDCVHYNKQLAEALGVDLVDIISVPGPDGLFKKSRDAERKATIGWLKLLIGAHHPTAIAIVGHYQCAGNPANDAQHDLDVGITAANFKKDLGFAGTVAAFSTVWHDDSSWSLKKIAVAELPAANRVLSPIQFSPAALLGYFRREKQN